jgi:hypothetical protein
MFWREITKKLLSAPGGARWQHEHLSCLAFWVNIRGTILWIFLVKVALEGSDL